MMANRNSQTALARLSGLQTNSNHHVITPSTSLSRSLTFGSESDSLSLRQSVSKSSNYTVVEPTPGNPADDETKQSKSKKADTERESSESRKSKKRRKSRRILHLYTPSASRSPSRSPSPNFSVSESETTPKNQYVTLSVHIYMLFVVYDCLLSICLSM